MLSSHRLPSYRNKHLTLTVGFPLITAVVLHTSVSVIFVFSPNSILASNSKQKSAFAPVRAAMTGGEMGFGPSTGGFGMTGLQAGWAHTFYNVCFLERVCVFIVSLCGMLFVLLNAQFHYLCTWFQNVSASLLLFKPLCYRIYRPKIL